MQQEQTVVIIGAGVFGVGSAIALRARGWSVTLVDPSPLPTPHPRASSTDISKAVRMDYGADLLYVELAEEAIEHWQRWNRHWERPLYHQDGFLMMSQRPLAAGDFEYDGFNLLQRRGQPVQRIDAQRLAERFPSWNSTRYVDGYFNPTGGWAESGKVLAWMIGEAARHGVTLLGGARFERLLENDRQVSGVQLTGGRRVEANVVLVAAGAWTPKLLPWLGDRMKTVGQQVLHFKPRDATPFLPNQFPVWGADISRTGWYGFPANAEGVVKVGHHGAGIEIDPGHERDVDAAHEAACREFLADSFPALARAEIVGKRVCLYCDSFDGDFWIDRDPQRAGLVVAAGGSGHGFKFAPLVGEWVADRVEGKSIQGQQRFGWREATSRRAEQARFVPKN